MILKNKKLQRELLYYLIVGLVGTLLDFGFFYFCSWLGVAVLFSQWLASFVGFMHNHLWQHFFVFEHNQRFRKTYILNFIISFLAVIGSGPLLLAFAKLFGVIWFSKLVVIGLNTIILYALRKTLIFTKK